MSCRANPDGVRVEIEALWDELDAGTDQLGPHHTKTRLGIAVFRADTIVDPAMASARRISEALVFLAGLFHSCNWFALDLF
jgi:hypothetical protein